MNEQEIIDEIKKQINEKIRPVLINDGGNIEFVEYNNDTGILKVKLLGACNGCPLAGLTLKNAVEGILKDYVPEISRVESIPYDEEDIEF